MRHLMISGLALCLLAACGGGGGSDSPANTPPTVAKPADVSLIRDAVSAPIALMLADAETPAEQLSLSLTSSNTALIDAAGLVVSGSGATRSLVLRPKAGQSGTATITLVVNDGGGLSANASFLLTVSATQVSFAGFVASAYAQGADSEPAVVDGLEFQDGTADDPGAYDGLLGP
ncbi:MAG: hypothetical protein HYV16_08485 [Gammaproteobacteria bacterium]|nr:hypothetical protein [Gammaproteobacteria bacterium]